MTSLNNPVNLPLDTNGYVKSSIWGQNMNPNVNTVASVTANVKTWATIYHLTGQSATVSTALAPVNIGPSFSITNDGKIQISLKGHVSAGEGFIDFTLTRNSVIYYFVYGSTATNLSYSGWISSQMPHQSYISNTSAAALIPLEYWTTVGSQNESDVLNIGVLTGDSIQFRVSNNTAADITYIDDLLVQQQ